MGVLRAGAAFGAALALHAVGLWAVLHGAGPMAEQVAGAGDSGQDRLSVAGASPALAAQIAAWEAPPPEPPPRATAPPDAPAVPVAPTPAPPVAPASPVKPPEPPPQAAAKQVPAPPTRPAPKKPAEKPAEKPPKPAAARTADRAQGAGGGQVAGAQGQARSAQGQSGADSLRAEWAGGVRAAIERRKSYPQAAGQATGAVGLRLSMDGQGRLLAVDVASPSGNIWLDRAAVEAARSAAPFAPPPAGAGLDAPRLTVTIRFAR